jgi:uncharacterized repeat protein (TIGR03803 family)
MRSKNIVVAINAVLAVLAVTTLMTATRAAAQETVLYNFDCTASGCEPGSNLIFDAAGNLYGTSPYGGTTNYGVVFELSPQVDGGWTEVVLHSFSNNGHDGYHPQGGLIFDGAGNLYGTTSGGGVHKGGTVFELAPATGGGWTEFVLHNFGGGTDGSEPNGGLVMDAAGNLYGTTTLGGVHSDGTAFELTPVTGEGWTEKMLHSFSGTTDGSDPWAGLTFDAAGNLYGTTIGGGAYNGGTVFQLTPQASGQWAGKVLHSFGEVNANGVSIYEPYGGVTFDEAGNLYGTTYYGGGNGGGVVYELTPATGGAWKETPVRNFGGTGGSNPLAGVVFDTVGNLYGTTLNGGDEHGDCSSTGCGVVFELTPAAGGGWTESVLVAFNYSDGGHPTGCLVFDSAGNLYGTTTAGGSGVFGTVFDIAH